MTDEDNYQWDETYPRTEDIISDIQARSLQLVMAPNHAVVGCCTIDCTESPEYQQVSWSNQARVCVIHRLVINSEYCGLGLSQLFFDHAHLVARNEKCGAIRSDTGAKNKIMKYLFLKHGFKYMGETKYAGYSEIYEAYEKILTN